MMKTLLVSLLLFVCLGPVFAEEAVDYDRHKVYKVLPKTEEEANVLNKYKEDNGIDFLDTRRTLEVPINVMVSPDAQDEFENSLRQNKIHFTIALSSVGKKVKKERERQETALRSAEGSVTFRSYMRIHEINAYLIRLATTYPSFVKIEKLGESFEGRPLLALKISSGSSNKNPVIFVGAGIHAREWIAPATALYVIHQLVEKRKNADLYQNVDWIILPSMNPDGYEFSHTTDRFWRKTRRPNTRCIGTDPNRNFDFHWMEIGSSDDECRDTYAGPYAFSEKETQAIRDYVLSHKENIKLYLDLHSYGPLILYPWGHTSAPAENSDELYALGEIVSQAIHAVNGTNYTIGSSANILYASSGGSDDYVKGVGGIELTYCIELPGGDYGFDPPDTQILSIVQETWEGVKAFHNYIENKFLT